MLNLLIKRSKIHVLVPVFVFPEYSFVDVVCRSLALVGPVSVCKESDYKKVIDQIKSFHSIV